MIELNGEIYAKYLTLYLAFNKIIVNSTYCYHDDGGGSAAAAAADGDDDEGK